MRKLYFLSICFFTITGSLLAQSFSTVDILAGNSGSAPYGMTTWNGKVYFEATDSVHGYELWSSDGTPGGTAMLKDILPGQGSSYPSQFFELNGKLIFVANDSIHGGEIWSTDGTPAGTNMLLDLLPGNASSLAAELTPFNNKIYFTGSDSTFGEELWVTDGTVAGTVMVKDIVPGVNGSDPIGDGGNPNFFIDQYTVFNGKIYFDADDGVHGNELWSSDGTALGTTMVSDINSGPSGSYPRTITVFNGKIYFSADDSVHGTELWASDGTAGGTTLVKDINPGIDACDAAGNSKFTEYNGKLYFDADNGSDGDELWATDGTTAGTSMIKDIFVGANSSEPAHHGFFVYNNKLFFNAYDAGNNNQLWSSDGTTAGTSIFKVLSTFTPYTSSPEGFINYNGWMIFQAGINPTDGIQLWQSDGTPTGTHIIAPANSSNASPLQYNYGYDSYAILNGSLFFDANFTSTGDELWAYTIAPNAITETSGDQAISAYPNPFSQAVTVSGLQVSSDYTILIMDMAGHEYYRTDVGHTTQTQITVPDLSTGVYLIRIAGPEDSRTFRLVRN